MTYSSFDIETSYDNSGTGGSNRSYSGRRVITCCFVTMAVGFAIGIMIGHFAIDKGSDSNSNDVAPVTDAIVGDQSTTSPLTITTSMTSSEPDSTTPEVSTTSMTSSEPASTTPEVNTTTPTETKTTICITSLPTTQSSTVSHSTSVTTGSDVTTTSAPNTDVTSEAVTTSEPERVGVFLEGVPESIIRDADPNITDYILREINGSNIRQYLRNLTSTPHIAGTDRDLEQADQLKQFWLDSGLDKAYTTPYDILLSYPSDTLPNKVRLLLNETQVIVESPDNEENLTPAEWSEDFPFPYLGYSGNGTVRGNIVYANYARLTDFEELEGRGINVSGHIVLARYGMGFRGTKVKLAEDRGALGVILYSDPADYIAPWATNVYNESIWIPPGATSRGSIFMGTGDPLTPGYPAIASAFRYDETDPEANLLGIPAMPIGYDTAKEILNQLGGSDAPEGWSGRLLNGTAYKLGTNFTNERVIAELSVHSRNERRTSYNAFGVIHGESEPDRYVMLGNHRDSWVLGAIDPSSGTATMMELSRVLGQLVKEKIWRPRRTIIFCSWGAEEFGLIGSTEWVEENSKVLDFRSIAYINMDIAVTGNYTIRGLGSPPVFSAMYRAAQKVPDPAAGTDGVTVFDTWTDRRPLLDPGSGDNLSLPIINSPGASSDYGTFQMRAGITCADFRYDQNFAGDGVLFYPLYHTSYETFYAVDELIDPGFKLHATIGKLSGELLRDLADSKLIPFNMTDYTMFLEHYYFSLVKHANSTLAKYNINTTELEAAISLYKESAVSFHGIVESINLNNPFEIRRINDQLMQIDRAFLDPASLPGREQIYRHLIHSTSENSTFSAASFPGLKDAIYKLDREPDNERHIRELRHHFSVLVFTIQGAAFSLKDTTFFFREHL